MPALTLNQIETVLRNRKDQMALEYGVAGLGVFGSYARGEAAEGSDVDLLVEFDRPIGFFKFLQLEEKLGEWLGAKVDLVTKPALKPHIGKRILEEVEMI